MAVPTVYPNPTSGMVRIDLGAPVSQARIRVINAMGQEVARKQLANSRTLNVELAGAPGLYFIEIVRNNAPAFWVRVMKE